MPKRTRKKDLEDALAAIPADRAGLPAKDSIQAVERFVSPQNDEYQILKTTEVDAYDEPPEPKPSRRSRKTSIAAAAARAPATR